MDQFSRYLLALHLAFAMPDSPPAIFTPPGVPSPSAPGAVHASPSPSPATPAVIHAPPLAGGAASVSVTGVSVDGTPLSVSGMSLLSPEEAPGWAAYYEYPGGQYATAYDSGNGWWVFWDTTEPNIAWKASCTFEEVPTPDLASGWFPEPGSPFALTGMPVFSMSSGLSAPPSIHSAPARTPGTPPVITP